MQTLLLQRSDLHKMCVIMLQVVKGPNMRDQIAFYAFHSFLVEVLCMCNSKLEIRIKTNPLSLMPATIKLKLLEKKLIFYSRFDGLKDTVLRYCLSSADKCNMRSKQ